MSLVASLASLSLATVVNIEWTLSEPWVNLEWTLSEHWVKLERRLSRHWVNLEWTLSEPWVNIEWSLREHWVDIEWTLSEPWANLEWTLSEHWVNLEWTLSEHYLSFQLRHEPGGLLGLRLAGPAVLGRGLQRLLPLALGLPRREPVISLVTQGEYSHNLSFDWSHNENIRPIYNLIGHTTRIFAQSIIWLVTQREYSPNL
jgi:hypothetical protein